MRTISYTDYLNKIYGCFVGKAISGNIGAPHEGVKMQLDLPYRPDMIDESRPNDDLDLQILWLDVAEKKGEHFTSYDLLERFVTHCSYSPGEYAVMRKNFHRGVYPPYSGRFCNDYFKDGMGCPIRSEIWACLAVGNKKLAAEFASRDGILDHVNESVIAEQFLAALEAEAFFESDMDTLIDRALTVVPADCRFRELVNDTRAWCKKYGDSKVVLTKILFRYGHPDCTNMFQNLGITLTALLLGKNDIIKTSLLALNCGNDTDCTCATAGAIIGILRGADELNKAYNLTDTTYKLGVKSDRRSNKVRDLAEDIAALGLQFAKICNTDLVVTDAPEVHFDFEPIPELTVTADYPGRLPTIALGGKADVVLTVTNNTESDLCLACEADAPNGLICSTPSFMLCVAAKSAERVALSFSLPKDVPYVYDQNLINFTAHDLDGEVYTEFRFGLVGEVPYKLCGPFWRTEPIITTEEILANFSERYPYQVPIHAAFIERHPEGNETDFRRDCQISSFADVDTAFIGEKALFAPLTDEWANPKYEETLANVASDSFRPYDHFGFRGPGTCYFARVMISPADLELCVQIGYSAPFELYLNGELLAKRDNCTNYTGENVHLDHIRVKKGENRLVLRTTNRNDDAKYSIVFSKGLCLAEHYVCFASKNPYLW